MQRDGRVTMGKTCKTKRRDPLELQGSNRQHAQPASGDSDRRSSVAWTSTSSGPPRCVRKWRKRSSPTLTKTGTVRWTSRWGCLGVRFESWSATWFLWGLWLFLYVFVSENKGGLFLLLNNAWPTFVCDATSRHFQQSPTLPSLS